MSTAPTLAYEVVDVFTDSAFAGNPLAVVLDADDLTTAQLQTLAAEFNLSETAFPMQAADGADYRLRIFTPSVELPFAGHPSVGAAWLLARLGRLAPGSRVQSCGAGLLPVQVSAVGGPVTLTGGASSCGEPLDPAPLLAAVGLDAEDLAGVAARAAGAGIDWTYLLVRPEALTRVTPHPAGLAAMTTTGIAVVTWQDGRARARCLVGGEVGMFEDPATGSAAVGLGVFLAASGLLGDGSHDYTVTQGVEMGRPSTLLCTVDVLDGLALRTTVTGSVVQIARGEIRVPAV